MPNPYESLPEKAFWRTGVAQLSPFQIGGLWNPKFKLLKRHRIITAGSCFAQHIGRALAERGYGWFDAEPAPAMFSPNLNQQYGYGIFSFRTGNIYTVAALKQWVEWALGKEEPPEEIWEKDGRYYDPFRPAIEPKGFASAQELRRSRSATLVAIRRAIKSADIFVFTLGLTEAWLRKKSGYVYAMCPGTAAGEFDASLHTFKNFAYGEIERDLLSVIQLVLEQNSEMRFLLTVSPVPLTATASGEHVLTSTVYSKSVLRAVAGAVSQQRPDTDYFPSYEIIAGAPFRSMFYEPNLRSVVSDGVDFVMRSFFQCQDDAFGAEESDVASIESGKKRAPAVEGSLGPKKRARRHKRGAAESEDVVCEEAMLDAFGKP